jgi:hypothetical protein
MPNVKLLVDVAEGGRDLAKACEGADSFGLGKKDPKYPRLKIIYRDGKSLPFVEGTVVTMSDDGAMKWMERALCELTSEPRTEYR